MARRGAIACLIFLLTGPAVTAQDHFLVQEAPQGSAPNGLVLFTDPGSCSTVLARVPAGWLPTHATVDESNDGFLVTAARRALVTDAAVLRMSASGALETLAKGPPLEFPQAALLDETGNWFIVDHDLNGELTRFFRLDAAGRVTSLGAPVDLSVLHAAVDRDSGAAVLLAFRPRDGYVLVHVDPAGGGLTHLTTLATGFNAVAATEPLYEPSCGHFVTASKGPSRYPVLYRITPQAGTTSIAAVPVAGDPVVMGRFSSRAAPSEYGLLVRTGLASHPTLVRMTGAGTVTSILGLSTMAVPRPGFMVRRGSRHLAPTAGLPPAHHELRVSFPAYAGRGYVVGLSLRGTLPGIGLPDGRVIALAPDGLTLLSVSGGVPGIVEGTFGLLDGSGRGRVTLDLTSVQAALRGRRIHAAAVVIDPAAPGGIAETALPVGIDVR